MKFLTIVLLTVFVFVVGAVGSTRPNFYKNGFAQEFSSCAVLLTNGDIIHGHLIYYHELDMVVVSDSTHKQWAFPANKVRAFAVEGLLPLASELIAMNPRPKTAEEYMFSTPSIIGRNVVWPRAGRYPVVAKAPEPLLKPYQHFLWENALNIRVFQTFLWNDDHEGNRLRPAFFEKLSDGPNLLLRRQELVSELLEKDSKGINRMMVINDRFYISDSSGNVVRLRQPKKALLSIYKPCASALQTFANRNHLSFDNQTDLYKIVTFANSQLH